MQSFIINGFANWMDCTLIPGYGNGKTETTCDVKDYTVGPGAWAPSTSGVLCMHARGLGWSRPGILQYLEVLVRVRACPVAWISWETVL